MSEQKPRVHGLGGVFFKSRDPAALGDWYRRHLGLDVQPWGGTAFEWQRRDREQVGHTIWSPFAQDNTYFEPSKREFMLNLRVDDIDAVLAALRDEGCNVLDRREDSDYGRFGYVVDPDGTLIELWQPPGTMPGAE